MAKAVDIKPWTYPGSRERSIVHHDNRVPERNEVGYRGAQHGVLVICRYDNENGVRLHTTSSAEPTVLSKIRVG